MKLFYIILFAVVFSTPAKADETAKTIYSDVDVFYDNCANNDEENPFIEKVCEAYVLGIESTYSTFRILSKNIQKDCYTNITSKKILQRFKALYQRNTFPLGFYPNLAIIQSIDSLCPKISEQQYDLENK